MSGQQSVTLKSSGIYTHPNSLSASPAGSVSESLNTVIDRNEVTEPRRGFPQYGSTFGDLGADVAKQLINYKDIIIRHVISKLQFDSDINGDFRDVISNSNLIEEIQAGLRIKSIEANGNLYIASKDGIKKISARDRLDLLNVGITDAGGVKALDINVFQNFSLPGFFEPNSKVAYRVLFGYKDLNENLILGSPSAPTQSYNSSTSSCFVDLTFSLPQGLDTSYFYQIYRTALSKSDVPSVEPGDPGDEMNLIFEENITAANITVGSISTTDITPEDFRRTGTLLYTNPVSGEGIAQANERPPFAKDITSYKGYTFYSNTSSIQRLNFSILTVEGINNATAPTIQVSTVGTTLTVLTSPLTFEIRVGDIVTVAGVSRSITVVVNPTTYTLNTAFTPGLTNQTAIISRVDILTITDNQLVTQTYTFQGGIETVTSDYSTTTPADLFNPVSPAPALTAKYFTIISANDERKYYVWNYATANDVDPILNVPALSGYISIKVVITTTETIATAKVKIMNAILAATDDFNITNSTTPNTLIIACSNNGPVLTVPTENITNFTTISDNLGTGEDITANKIFLPRVPTGAQNGPTVAQQIEQLSKSLIRVINKNNTLVAGYYQSTYLSVPGQMLLEGREAVGPIFYLLSTVGTNFTPTLSSTILTAGQVQSSNEVRPNRLMYSKFQQPEAVPLANYIDIGPKDRANNRIIALRDSLFILKEDGIYRLSGDVAPFSVTAFDFSVQVLAPDTAVVLNNQIYALSTQGVIRITEGGIDVISRPIEDKIIGIFKDGFNYKTIAFGVSYESDRAYHLWLPTNITDTYATQCFRYNTFTNTWTRWNKNATCGIVNFGDNKLYLAPGDLNVIEKERKTLTRIDHADRQFNKAIVNITDTIIEIDSLSNVNIGDVFIQTQYLTIDHYNRLLKKLDDDQFILTKNYISSLKLLPGGNVRNAIENLAVKLDLDSNVIFTNYASLVSDYTNTVTSIVAGASSTTLTITGLNNIKVGRYVTVNGYNTFPKLNSSYKVMAVTATTIVIDAVLTFVYTPAGSVTVKTDITNFKDSQGCYNLLTNQLNVDNGLNYKNYPQSAGSFEFESVLLKINQLQQEITVPNKMDLIEGPIVLYNAIETIIIYNPQFFGDVSTDKQVREGTAIFENDNFSTFTIGYASDKFPSFIDTIFNRPGNGDFGQSVYSQNNWGGIAAPIPLRTYVPMEKQRCRFIVTKLRHKVALEKYSLFGITLNYRPYNIRTNT